MKCERRKECRSVRWGACTGDFDPRRDVCKHFIPPSEHGADAGTPVSGPSLCSPASPRAGDKGAGLEGKPPVPRRVGEPGNAGSHFPRESEVK